MSSSEIIILVVSGMLAGYLGGLLGIGGGVVAVPVFTLLLGLEPKIAIGTSLMVIFPTALVGSIVHFKSGNVHLNYAFIFVAVSIIGTVIGAKTANIMPADLLRKIFAVVFVVVAIKMFFAK